ncbi:MAG: DNA-protecting protein DprA [Candidatus Vogelbacteria bacterium CG10_big_fil_rev_8_21_14_0_10_49_38]|uniref:DNA-protecting protein DprA n=1 Tax=Candidatus Vogelbacteria bacterium CG10_big_fil_rev_8_21_14_0_10_49_38 TaxID=1975043 RepID=A0A2H0RHY1_9BACT|nr:MAG: DNA protecting protein DprA [bacterium CG10_49_38]PIR46161.1 MAG: DNA-protecting protein DprA [Candidatus Vogelbacteria bacterium CG10_big_fil_rev_8_21_14_0_10_49_38]
MTDHQAVRKVLPANFPSRLKEISDPPNALYIEGDWPDPVAKWLAVVGSRRHSRYGLEACQELLAGLVGQPIVIISGLAIGIDTIAHRAALKHRLPTIAVPGSGLDRSVLHPSSNCRLADEIVAGGGALVSELEPTQPAGIHTFPRRNRIMAGLADAVLIIEAGEKSGTLITARLALDYNREVLAVPGSIFSPVSRGVNTLIRQGAMPVNRHEDILQALNLFEENEGKDDNRQTRLFADLSPDEKKIVDLLAVEPLPRDELIELAELSASAAAILLSTMEIKGLIRETLGEVRLA